MRPRQLRSAPTSLAEVPAATRKTVTVLFCDVVALDNPWRAGSTPRRCERVMSRFFERMAPIVERHGGTVEKFVGDAVMAVFGVPVVHEDDALRAVRARRRDAGRAFAGDSGARRRGSASTRARSWPATRRRTRLVTGEPS